MHGTKKSGILLVLVQLLVHLGSVVTYDMLAILRVKAQTVESVAASAKQITVRIETAASPGSGVLVKREGNRYTVLTAWHVISQQKSGEELDIFTSDNTRHPVDRGSIKRLGNVDLGILTFSSTKSYEIAKVGETNSVAMGSPIYVSGFPLPSSAVPARLLRFMEGRVIANASVNIPNGYQLLYSNQTLPGMSGGSVLNTNGQLVGVHGQGETDSEMTEQEGIVVKTGTNQAVPISYYSQYSSGILANKPINNAVSVDDYLAKAISLDGKEGNEQEVIKLANHILATHQIAEAYLMRADAKFSLGDLQDAISDYSKAINVDSQISAAYNNRGTAKLRLGEYKKALADLNQAVAIAPQKSLYLSNRGAAKEVLGDLEGAMDDLDTSIVIDSKSPFPFYVRAVVKSKLGDRDGAIADYSKAIALDPRYVAAYVDRGFEKQQAGDLQGAVIDYNQAIIINPGKSVAYKNRGLAYWRMGEPGKACLDWRQAASLGMKDVAEWVNVDCD